MNKLLGLLVACLIFLYPNTTFGESLREASLVIKPGGKTFLDPGGETMGTRDISFADKYSGDEFFYYKDAVDLTSMSRLEILLEEEDSSRRAQDVSLNINEMERMTLFLRTNPPADCSGFVHVVKGVPYTFGEFDKRNWGILKTDIRTDTPLKRGDVVALSKDKKLDEPVHFAIYLDEGLFISKYGPDGKLIVTTLEEMGRVFKPKYVLLIKPR